MIFKCSDFQTITHEILLKSGVYLLYRDKYIIIK